ncbi:DUF2264 domain-containing protein [Pseudonocardia aurantiaca]|uniref:DUF2264 domain-containing protein n=1 Tax=Pseudonocardia aurantiaca TaxID=75290 RepID=A0ABW4FSY8_9PSEU
MGPAVAQATGPRMPWERTADRMLLALRRYATDGNAQIRLPGVASHNGVWSDGLEGFARSFLLAAFRLAGAGGADPHGFAGWYASGLSAGVDPASPERWPTFAESSQARVEAASVAIALHETRPWIWDRLPARTQEQLLSWFAPMVGNVMPPNNWIWFQAVTEAFARGAGGDWRQDDLDRTIALTEDWYAAAGWYSDGLAAGYGHAAGGHRRNFDHYNGWAMHLYPLWYCRIAGQAAESGLLDRYRERLRRFLADQRVLVGANGSPLIQGRSLTYRFAALAPVWAGALFDATPLGPGETRALAARTLDHFLAHGALDDEGLLSLGWHRPFRGLLQGYSGPASPYWASKGFIGLLLPPEHPVWTAPEEPLAVERGDVARTLVAPGWLVSATAADGVVRVVNHGSDHTDPAALHSDDPSYARLTYSTHAAPDMPEDPAGGPVDGTATLVDADGRAAHRRPLRRLAVAGATGVSRSRAHWPDEERWDAFGGPRTGYRLGPWITVGSVLRGAIEIRAVRVDPATTGDDPGELRLRLGGWALPVTGPDAATTDAATTATVTGSNGVCSAVVALHGFDRAGVHHATDANPLGARSATPVLWRDGPVAPGAVHVAAVHLGGAELVRAELPGVAVTADGSAAVIRVTWPGGTHDVLTLPAPDESDEASLASSDRKDPTRA